MPLITESIGATGKPIGDDPYQVGIAGDAHLRLIFLDIGKSDLGSDMTAMILITAPDEATFNSFVNEAMPVVQSFHFR